MQVCSGQCVDTATDNKNCGGCGKTCDFTCAMGQCGPTSIPTGVLFDKVFTLDTTNVYWIDSHHKTQVIRGVHDVVVTFPPPGDTSCKEN